MEVYIPQHLTNKEYSDKNFLIPLKVNALQPINCKPLRLPFNLLSFVGHRMSQVTFLP